MVDKRRKYYYKLYVNIKNKKLWDVIQWCNDKDIFPSDFISTAAIEKWERANNAKSPKAETKPQLVYDVFIPPVVDEEAEETDRLLASGEWEVVEDE